MSTVIRRKCTNKVGRYAIFCRPLIGEGCTSRRLSRPRIFLLNQSVSQGVIDFHRQRKQEHAGYGIVLSENICTSSVNCFCFYRAMHFSAKRGIAIACRLSVRPSVRLSVTLVDCDHIGWNTPEIISPLDSVGCSLSANPNTMGLLQGKHPEIFA